VKLPLLLTEKYGITPEKAQDIARVQTAIFYAATKLINHSTNDYFERYRNLMRLCYAKHYNELFDWVDGIARLDREEQKEFLSYAL